MCLPNLSLTSSKVRERVKRTWRMILWGGSRCSSTLSNRHEKISISISICKSWSLKTDGLEFRSEPNIQNSSMGVTGEMWALHLRSDLFPFSWLVAYGLHWNVFMVYSFPWKSLFQGDDGLELPALEHGDSMIAVTNSNWRQGRQLLRQYLQVLIFTTFSPFIFLIRFTQEIGYTDTIIDVRSNRVRSLLGLQADQVESDTLNI